MATDPAPGRWGLSITVHGTPAGQGAVSFLGKGRPAVHTNQKKLLPWRAAIQAAANQAMSAQCATPHPAWVGEPMEVDMTVTVPKPKTAPKRRRSWPITRYSSDIDHHARAVLDSLTHAGVFGDDSQVVQVTARKVYPGEHELALDGPGAVIRVRVLPEAVGA